MYVHTICNLRRFSGINFLILATALLAALCWQRWYWQRLFLTSVNCKEQKTTRLEIQFND